MQVHHRKFLDHRSKQLLLPNTHNLKAAVIIIFDKFCYIAVIPYQDIKDCHSFKISGANPNNLWGEAKQGIQIVEIRILSHNNIILPFCKFPNLIIRKVYQSLTLHMRLPVELFGKKSKYPMRDILIKKKSHTAI